MATYIVFLGAPGVGKGTQAERLAEELKIPHISTGDLFRENLKNQTELGKKAQYYMDAGQLVPDDVTIEMVKSRISRPDCVNGAILDGFPRTSAQAEAFDQMLKEAYRTEVDFVPCIQVDRELLIDRLSGRRMCPNGHVFHMVYHPPKEDEICDICGQKLYQREDDKAETIEKRLEVYENQTAPLIDYYQKRNVLRFIDGAKDIDAVTMDILAAFKDVTKK